MKRQKRELALQLAGSDRGRLADRGSVLKYGDLILRVRADRVRAHLAENSRSNAPPHFRGRAATESDGTVVVRGVIRESWGQVAMPRVSFFVALWMVVFIAIGIAEGLGSGGLPTFLLGAAGLPIFVLIAAMLGRLRKDTFHRCADQLQAALRTQLNAAYLPRQVSRYALRLCRECGMAHSRHSANLRVAAYFSAVQS